MKRHTNVNRSRVSMTGESQLSESQPSESQLSQPLDRKALQLCSQIRYALEYAIHCVSNGQYGLTVLDVVPAPNTAHVLVFVQSFEDLSFDECNELAQELKNRTSLLRTAVSESIHRKKTPGLSFQIVPRRPTNELT